MATPDGQKLKPSDAATVIPDLEARREDAQTETASDREREIRKVLKLPPTKETPVMSEVHRLTLQVEALNTAKIEAELMAQRMRQHLRVQELFAPYGMDPTTNEVNLATGVFTALKPKAPLESAK